MSHWWETCKEEPEEDLDIFCSLGMPWDPSSKDELGSERDVWISPLDLLYYDQTTDKRKKMYGWTYELKSIFSFSTKLPKSSPP